MADDPPPSTSRYQSVIHDAAREFTSFLEKTLEELSLKNTTLGTQNTALEERALALEQQIADLRRELRDRPDLESYTQHMIKASEMSDQIIQARDDCRTLDAANRALALDNQDLRTALQVSQTACIIAEKHSADAKEELVLSKAQIQDLSVKTLDLEKRLDDERRIYELSLKGKDKLISQLEEKLSILGLSDVAISSATDKENVVMAEPDHIAKPLRDLNGTDAGLSSTKTSSYESRYRDLRKYTQVLQTQYDSLRNAHEITHEKFRASRSRWSAYKASTQDLLNKLAEAHVADKKASRKSSAQPFVVPRGPGDNVLPSTPAPESRTAALAREVSSKLEEMELADNAMDFHDPPASTLHSGRPVAGPNFAEQPFLSPWLERTHRPPSPTISEEPLSQAPRARLADLDDMVANDDQRAQPAPTAEVTSPNRRRSVEVQGAREGILAVKQEVSVDPLSSKEDRPPHPLLPPPTTPLAAIPPNSTASSSKTMSSSTKASARPFNQLEAMFFVKSEQTDDPDITVVGDDPPVTPSPSKRSYQSAKKKQDIREKLLRQSKEKAQNTPTPATGLDSPRPVLGKRKSPIQDPERDILPLATASASTPGVASGSTAKGKNMMPKDYGQYKGRGRYAQTAGAPAPINALFEIDPTRNGGVDYQYDAVVRNKKQRKKMDATDCECCKEYYEAVGNLPPRNGGPRWRSPTTSPRKSCAHLRSNGEIDSDEEDPPTKSTHTTDQQRHDEGIQQHRKAIGRHRHDWEPASTPPDYWHIGFPDTQQIRSINDRADAHYEAKRAHIEREAE